MLRSVPLVPRLDEEELAGHPVRFSGEDGHAVQAGITQAILETDGDVRVEVPQLSIGVPLSKEARKALAQGGGGPRGHAVKVQLHPLVYFWAHIGQLIRFCSSIQAEYPPNTRLSAAACWYGDVPPPSPEYASIWQFCHTRG